MLAKVFAENQTLAALSGTGLWQIEPVGVVMKTVLFKLLKLEKFLNDQILSNRWLLELASVAPLHLESPVPHSTQTEVVPS